MKSWEYGTKPGKWNPYNETPISYEGMAIGGCRDGEMLRHNHKTLVESKVEPVDPTPYKANDGADTCHWQQNTYCYTEIAFQGGPHIGFWVEESLTRHARTPRDLVMLLIAAYMGEPI